MAKASTKKTQAKASTKPTEEETTPPAQGELTNKEESIVENKSLEESVEKRSMTRKQKTVEGLEKMPKIGITVKAFQSGSPRRILLASINGVSYSVQRGETDRTVMVPQEIASIAYERFSFEDGAPVQAPPPNVNRGVLRSTNPLEGLSTNSSAEDRRIFPVRSEDAGHLFIT